MDGRPIASAREVEERTGGLLALQAQRSRPTGAAGAVAVTAGRRQLPRKRPRRRRHWQLRPLQRPCGWLLLGTHGERRGQQQQLGGAVLATANTAVLAYSAKK